MEGGWAPGEFVRRCSAAVASGGDMEYCDALLNAVSLPSAFYVYVCNVCMYVMCVCVCVCVCV